MTYGAQKDLLKAFFGLIRLDYSLFSALAVFLSGFLSGDLRGFQFEYLIAFLIVFLSATGSFAFNDYYDFEVDKRNKRFDRPLVLGLIPRSVALLTGAGSILAVFLLSLLLNQLARAFVLFSLPLFFLYSIWFKKILILKNVVIAGAYVVTILFGSLVTDSSVEILIIYFAIMGFIVGLASEIMKDIMDVEGDKLLEIQTFSTRFGVISAAQVSVLLYIIIMILDPLPFLIMIDPRLHLDYLFLFLILIPVVSYLFISKALLKEQTRNRVLNLKKRLFLTMQVGCVAYLIGVLF